MSQALDFAVDCRMKAGAFQPVRPMGRVRAIAGTVIEAEGVRAEIGAIARIDATASAPVETEVIGFRDGITLLMPLGALDGVTPNAPVWTLPAEQTRPCAEAALGRVIDGLGRPIDGGPQLETRSVGGRSTGAPHALDRRPVDRALDVGVRAINALHTVGVGSRVGLFAGSGVGKSTLLGQMARFTEADAIVVGLVGERGREVREFVEGQLGEALARSIVVVATSDTAPVLRRRAAQLATELAEQLRDRGKRVLLLMDSLSRFCNAQREIGLAAGEPPATRGYPPSVWSELAKLVERAGTHGGRGDVTGIYTVLVEGDDPEDPIADAIRSLIDGHIVLSRRLAERGVHPAIDPLASVSRVMPALVNEEVLADATRARGIFSVHADAEDLLSIGAYQPGADPRLDEAVRIEPALRRFVCQRRDERATLAESREQLAVALAGDPS